MEEDKIVLKKIKDHQFLNRLFKDYQLTKKNDGLGVQKNNFVSKVYGRVAKINLLLESLQMVRIMVAEIHPSHLTENESSISKVSILKYHIENYFFRITTYRDLIYQLIFIVINFEGSYVSHRVLRDLKNFAQQNNDESILQLIDNTENLFSHVKTLRNTLAHEGFLEDIDINILETAHFLNKVVPSSFDKDDFQTYGGAIIIKNLREMMQVEEDLATNYLRVADELLKRYLPVIEA